MDLETDLTNDEVYQKALKELTSFGFHQREKIGPLFPKDCREPDEKGYLGPTNRHLGATGCPSRINIALTKSIPFIDHIASFPESC